MTTYRGSCQCGKIAYDVEADIAQAAECNCSLCSRRGYLPAFVPREKRRLHTPEADFATCAFNGHRIRHHFCPTRGSAPFAFGTDRAGNETAAVNVRCLEGVDPAALEIEPFDGHSL